MVTLAELGYDTSGMTQEQIDALNLLLENYTKVEEKSTTKVTEIGQRYTRNPYAVNLAQNTKESYEVLAEVFAGNDLYEQEKIARDVKLTKMIDLI